MSPRPKEPDHQPRGGHPAERLREFIAGRYPEDIDLPEGLPQDATEPCPEPEQLPNNEKHRVSNEPGKDAPKDSGHT
jgi:hypothetical protein